MDSLGDAWENRPHWDPRSFSVWVSAPGGNTESDWINGNLSFTSIVGQKYFCSAFHTGGDHK